MRYLGCHLSTTDGYAAMGRTAVSIGANTFAFFTRNPRSGRAKVTNNDDMDELNKIIYRNNFGKVVAHAPYIMNLCSDKQNIRESAKRILTEDLALMEKLPGNYFNLHPGSHMHQGLNASINYVARTLNDVLTPEQSTIVLLETMAGKGTEIGTTFEELRKIIDCVELKNKIGVCFDTCHVWDAGYDIQSSISKILKEFDDVIGLDHLLAVHFNDSLSACSSKRDRHAKIGKGALGLEAMKEIALCPALADVPFILETPCDLNGFQEEIATIRSWDMKNMV